MAQSVVGMFKYHKGADHAVEELRDLHYEPKDISVVMREVKAQEHNASASHSVLQRSASGAMLGGVMAAVAGLVVGVASVTIPGIGPIVLAGPIAGALGFTGIAAVTTTATLSGVVAGGLVGALVKSGFPQEHAKQYEEYIRAGGILIVVPTRNRRVEEVRTILLKHGASDVRQMDLFSSVEEYKKS